MTSYCLYYLQFRTLGVDWQTGKSGDCVYFWISYVFSIIGISNCLVNCFSNTVISVVVLVGKAGNL